jgi:hypothetical protein
VTADAETNTISVLNNCKGIPVVIHKDQDYYVPTLIFGHLLTECTFDNAEKKTTGGHNGSSAKLANIFSVDFVVECLNAMPQACVQRDVHNLFNFLIVSISFPIKLVGLGRAGTSVASAGTPLCTRPQMNPPKGYGVSSTQTSPRNGHRDAYAAYKKTKE